jgi:hypothetical protein
MDRLIFAGLYRLAPNVLHALAILKPETVVCTENLIRRCLQVKFPVPAKKIPVPRNIFPVNLRRELREKSLQHSSFLLGNRFGEAQNRKIPCRIPC